MSQYIGYMSAFIIAFVISFFATPLARKVAVSTGAIDMPKDNRRMHTEPIPRLGGLAIFAGFILSIAITLTLNNGFDMNVIGLILGSLVIVGTGIVDDIKGVRAGVKLLLQVIAALIVIIGGVQIEWITNPFSSGRVIYLDLFAVPVTLFWIVGVTNAINFIDGLDGLAAGVSSIAALSLLFISLFTGQAGSVILTAALAGSALGFLPFNFNPAKIIMGDTGSTFLGFSLGVISIIGLLKSYAAIAILVPILVLGVPIFDTVFAILRRLRSGRSIMEADRGHLHHRLIDMGLTHKQAVLALYGVSALLGVGAMLLVESGIWKALLLITAVVVFVITGSRYIGEGMGADIKKDDTKARSEDQDGN